MKIQIKSIYESLLFEGDFASLDEAIRAATKQKIPLRGSDLRGSNLSNSDLRGSKNSELAQAMTVITPQGELIGWKKCKNGIIVKLKIPADARRSNATGRKCRAEFADVLEISGGLTQCESDRGGLYEVGKRVAPDSWDENRWEECSHGIHFFITREEAEAYVL